MSFWKNFTWTSLPARVRRLWASEQSGVEQLLTLLAPYIPYAQAAVLEIELAVKQQLKLAADDQQARYDVLRSYFNSGSVTEAQLRSLAMASTKDALLGIGSILVGRYLPGSEWLLRCAVDFAYGLYVNSHPPTR